jgi:hypothetical protein
MDYKGSPHSMATPFQFWNSFMIKDAIAFSLWIPKARFPQYSQSNHKTFDLLERPSDSRHQRDKSLRNQEVLR